MIRFALGVVAGLLIAGALTHHPAPAPVAGSIASTMQVGETRELLGGTLTRIK
jgi:hypothetical protein